MPCGVTLVSIGSKELRCWFESNRGVDDESMEKQEVSLVFNARLTPGQREATGEYNREGYSVQEEDDVKSCQSLYVSNALDDIKS